MALTNTRKDFFTIRGQLQQTTYRKSDLVSCGARDLRGAENYLAGNNHTSPDGKVSGALGWEGPSLLKAA